MKRKKQNLVTRLMKMSVAQRDKFVSQYDREIPESEMTPPTREQQAQMDRVMARLRKRGGQQIGEGAKSVLVSIEKGLLREVDNYAKREKISRARMIAIALRQLMAGSGKRRKTA